MISPEERHLALCDPCYTLICAVRSIAMQTLEEGLKTKEAAEMERRKRISEADKHRLFTESVARR